MGWNSPRPATLDAFQETYISQLRGEEFPFYIGMCGLDLAGLCCIVPNLFLVCQACAVFVAGYFKSVLHTHLFQECLSICKKIDAEVSYESVMPTFLATLSLNSVLIYR